MQIILLDKIIGLGTIGETVNVKPGYARNFLIPKGKATLATTENLEYFEKKRTEVAARSASLLQEAKLRSQKIKELENITILAKSGNDSKLFGSIGRKDIAIAICKKGIEVNKNEIHIPNGTLRKLGKYVIKVKVHNNVSSDLEVNIGSAE